jgi:hypothetical protein
MTLKMNRCRTFRYNRGAVRAALAELADVPCAEELDEEIVQEYRDDCEEEDHQAELSAFQDRLDEDYDNYMMECADADRAEAWREFYV